MPRRPDPETGLLPEVEATMVMNDSLPEVNEYADAVSPPPSSTISRRTARTLSPSDRLTYPQLERAIETFRHYGGEVRQQAPQYSIFAEAQRDFARGGVNLVVRQLDQYHNSAVIENITWRAVQPGEEVPSTPFFLDERYARHLAEQLSDFNPQVRRANELRREYDDARNEVRSLANQLEEVRNHNNTLQNMNDEAQRQIRWLERELRDANRERREAAATA